jgi:hypothetical protein
LDFLQPQSNRWSRFTKRFPKQLQLHQKNSSTRGIKAEAVFRESGALTSRPCERTRLPRFERPLSAGVRCGQATACLLLFRVKKNKAI